MSCVCLCGWLSFYKCELCVCLMDIPGEWRLSGDT